MSKTAPQLRQSSHSIASPFQPNVTHCSMLRATGRSSFERLPRMALGTCCRPTRRKPRPRLFQRRQFRLRILALNAGNTIFGTRLYGRLSTGTRIKSIWIITQALNFPAASRYGATTPKLLSWFRQHNAGRAYADQVKPSNFLLAFQITGPQCRFHPAFTEITPKARCSVRQRSAQGRPIVLRSGYRNPYSRGTAENLHGSTRAISPAAGAQISKRQLR